MKLRYSMIALAAGTISATSAGVAQAQVLWELDFDSVTAPALPAGSSIGSFGSGGPTGSFTPTVTTIEEGTSDNALVIDADVSQAAVWGFFVQWSTDVAADLDGYAPEDLYLAFDARIEDPSDNLEDGDGGFEVKLVDAVGQKGYRLFISEEYEQYVIPLTTFTGLDLSTTGSLMFQPQSTGFQHDYGDEGDEYAWYVDNIQIGVVPEPASMLLTTVGLVGLAFRRGRRAGA